MIGYFYHIKKEASPLNGEAFLNMKTEQKFIF
jgi:hypothetical protein